MGSMVETGRFIGVETGSFRGGNGRYRGREKWDPGVETGRFRGWKWDPEGWKLVGLERCENG